MKWKLSAAIRDRILVVIFLCKFSASHEFFIHRERERLKQKEGMSVDMKWLCTVPALVSIFHGVSVSNFVFLSLFHCELYVEFNLSYWANMPKKISNVIIASFSLHLALSAFSQLYFICTVLY